jgi:type II secretory pathway pseudopilin PulG
MAYPPPYNPQGPYAPPPPPAPSKTPLALIIGIGVVVAACPCIGVLAAVAIPAFTRYVKRSKTSEATANLSSICSAISTYSQTERTGLGRFLPNLPSSAPRQGTPGSQKISDPETWQRGGWREMGFSINSPHYYVYEYLNYYNGTFRVMAAGDLDGDGIQSVFTRTGTYTRNLGASCGFLQIENELE